MPWDSYESGTYEIYLNNPSVCTERGDRAKYIRLELLLIISGKTESAMINVTQSQQLAISLPKMM